VSPEELAKKIRNRARWAILAEGLAGFARGLNGTSQSQTSVSAGGPRGFAHGQATTTTYDHTVNQAIIAERTGAIAHSAKEEEARRLTGALLATTLFPGRLRRRSGLLREGEASNFAFCSPTDREAHH
jgi:hypothetical protein